MKSFKNFLQEKVHADNEYTKLALEFFLNKFGVDTNKVTVVLKETATIKGPDGITQPASKDKFVIFIKKDHPRADRLRVIAHECAHVAQIVTNKMTFKKNADGNISIFYNGELVDPEKIPYRRRPWEIEAFTLEKRYIHDFIELHGNNFSEDLLKINLSDLDSAMLAYENMIKNSEKLESSRIMWKTNKIDTAPVSIMFNQLFNVQEEQPRSIIGEKIGIFVPKSKYTMSESSINTESWWFLDPQEILRLNKSKYKTIKSIYELKTYKDVITLLNEFIKWNIYLNEKSDHNKKY